MTTVAFILVVVGGLIWVAYRRPRPRRWLLVRRPTPTAVAAVDRQHRHLQAGGLLGTTACETTKARYRELLAAGRTEDVARELQPGLDFAVRVRALTEIGTPEAAGVLTRLLTSPLCADAVEQSWYWVDLAAGLRRLNRADALSAVLHCTDAAAELPPGAMLAAEAVSFPNFPHALRQAGTSRAAARALVTAVRSARDGVLDIAGLVRAGLGDVLADLPLTPETGADSWLVHAAIEAERVFRRTEHWARLLPADARTLAERQAARLWSTAEQRVAWLTGAADRLLARFGSAGASEQAAILRTLYELRADPTRLFPHLPDRRASWWEDAVRALRWSKSPAAGPVLAGLANRLTRSGRDPARANAVLTALRGHACHETERALVQAAATSDRTVKAGALGSLGWWAPYDPERVVGALRSARASSDGEVRRIAVAALARLGERAALSEVTAGLHSEEAAIRIETAALVAAEELTWLWPNLESAAASPDTDTALAAGEALARLRERLFGFRK
jgi:hypothetical protein